MRPYLIVIATLLAFSSLAQTGQLKVFKTTQYINGNLHRETNDTIKIISEQIDIYFFNKHFYSPYYLPGKFLDKSRKNQTISVWRDPNSKKDYQQNWENTYTYDSSGRVTNYTFSGCFICSSFPYNYTVTYNSLGQVEQIFNSINSKDDFKFYYDNKGDIVKFEKYWYDKLETEIVMIN